MGAARQGAQRPFLPGQKPDNKATDFSLRDMQREWLAERDVTTEFDWRYYMVKYPDMRSGGSGIYFAEGGKLGYSLCNLRGGMTHMNSRYRDPYLLNLAPTW
jgi:hypothetical protein